MDSLKSEIAHIMGPAWEMITHFAGFFAYMVYISIALFIDIGKPSILASTETVPSGSLKLMELFSTVDGHVYFLTVNLEDLLKITILVITFLALLVQISWQAVRFLRRKYYERAICNRRKEDRNQSKIDTEAILEELSRLRSIVDKNQSEGVIEPSRDEDGNVLKDASVNHEIDSPEVEYVFNEEEVPEIVEVSDVVGESDSSKKKIKAL